MTTANTGQLWLQAAEAFVKESSIGEVYFDGPEVFVRTTIQSPQDNGSGPIEHHIASCESTEDAAAIAERLVYVLGTHSGQAGLVELDEEGEFSLSLFS
ncbi:hypothetical protein [Sciscionella sediminilitoris]|uniref:hypothetical protein n=1 Tax=Sciscionella sediminilitoris TaxID=1445613 RepID=UPI0004DF9DA5|nr:hypothetical protein [Sciscionella sp. SE31]